MKKIVLAIISCISLNATQVIEYEIKNNINELDINLTNGTTGVVIHEYGFEKQTIVARAIVDNKQIKYKKFDDLNQTSLPSFKKVVHPKDKILFNYLYSEALLIAPNNEIYNNVIAIKRDKNWKSSDLFAGFLSMNANPKPQIEDFKKFAPFYSKVQNISENVLDFNNEVDDYNNHYKEMLGI
jgi:hypothetical protein